MVYNINVIQYCIKFDYSLVKNQIIWRYLMKNSMLLMSIRSKKVLVALSLSLIVVLASISLSFAAIQWYDWSEDEYGNTMENAEKYLFSTPNVGFRTYGVVSSADAQDWYGFICNSASGVANFSLESDVSANIYLYDNTGRLLYQGYDENGIKTISYFYLRKGVQHYIKVEYVSGVPTKPYTLRSSLESASLMSASKIINKEDIDDKNLLPKD